MVDVAELTVAANMAPPPIQRIEQQALAWPDRAAAVEIKDQPTYDAAVDLLRAVKGLRDEAETHHRPVIDAAHKAHKAALAALKRVDEPLILAEGTIKRKIGAWDQEQERIRKEAELAAQKEAERLHAEQLERELEALEASGAKPAEVKAVIEQAEFTPIVAPRPVQTYQPASGVSTQERWSAEVFNLLELVRFVGANPQFIQLLQVNQTALNTMARAMKQTMNFPGVKVRRDVGVSMRR